MPIAMPRRKFEAQPAPMPSCRSPRKRWDVRTGPAGRRSSTRRGSRSGVGRLARVDAWTRGRGRGQRISASAREAAVPRAAHLYGPDDVRRFQALVAPGTIPDPPRERSFRARTIYRRSAIPILAISCRTSECGTASSLWAVCAFGRHETACVVAAAALGGHARVRFENNLHLPDGTGAPDNAALVHAFVSAIAAIGLPIASPDEARRVLSGETAY